MKDKTKQNIIKMLQNQQKVLEKYTDEERKIMLKNKLKRKFDPILPVQPLKDIPNISRGR